jgi:hypothetical protein
MIHNKRTDCFNIVESRLTKEQARAIEKQLIAKYNPKYNKSK